MSIMILIKPSFSARGSKLWSVTANHNNFFPPKSQDVCGCFLAFIRTVLFDTLRKLLNIFYATQEEARAISSNKKFLPFCHNYQAHYHSLQPGTLKRLMHKFTNNSPEAKDNGLMITMSVSSCMLGRHLQLTLFPATKGIINRHKLLDTFITASSKLSLRRLS